MKDPTVVNVLLPLLVLLPLGGAFLALILSRFWSRAGRFIAVAFTAATLVISGHLMWAGARGTVWGGGWNPLDLTLLDANKRAFTELRFSEIGGIALSADGLSLLMLVLVAAISTLVAVYASSYMTRYTARNRFYALFLLMIAGMNGCVMSGDLFNFFVFLEVASIASYALVGFGTESEELEASFKYLVLGSVASIFFLFGVALTWGAFGTLNFGQVARGLERIGGLGQSPIMLLVAALFILGLGLKAAMVPFHAWLPDAHPSAPAPISAMLSGLLIKALGVYAIARILFGVLGAWRVPALAWVVVGLGVLSMVVGVLMAVGQWDFKRLLAYHSISQMGYVVLGLGMALLLMPGAELKRLNRLEEGILRTEGVVTSLRVELSTAEPLLQGIEEGLLEEKKAGPGGVEGLRDKIKGFRKRLKTLEDRAEDRERAKVRIARAKHNLVRNVGAERLDRLAGLPGLELALALALMGAIFHMVNHAVFKSLLFLCAGAIERATGTRNLKELGGLWQRMPVTSASCAVGALSISGVPPFNGFWSKLLIIAAAGYAGYWGLAAVTVVVSFLTLVSFVKVQKYALFGPMSARVLRGTREAPASMCFSLVVLAAVCFLLGALALLVIPWAINPAVKALQSGVEGWFKLLGPLGLSK